MHRLFLIGKPETKQQIWDALASEGFPSDSNRPSNTVHWALQRRAKKHGDVLLVEPGKWGLRAWYTDEQLENLARNIGGMGGRDREVHSAKTKRGIETLKARGVRWGRPSKVTAEHMAIFKQKRAEGASFLAAARATGLSLATLKYQAAKYDLENWNAGDSWPPAPKIEETETSDTETETSDTDAPTHHLRVVGQN